MRNESSQSNKIAALVDRFTEVLLRRQECNQQTEVTAKSLRVVLQRAANLTDLEHAYTGSRGKVELQEGFSADLLAQYPGLNASGCLESSLIEYQRTPLVSRVQNETDRIDSVVLSMTAGPRTGNVSVTGLTNATAVLLTFVHRVKIPAPRKCVYWDEEELMWSDEGCELVWTSPTQTQCRCYHLTSFALLAGYVLTEPHVVLSGHEATLELLTYIGCSLSIVGCLLIVLVFVCVRKLRRLRPQKVLVNLALAILFLNVFFLSGIGQIDSGVTTCRAMAALIYYFLMATLCWSMCVAYDMRFHLVKVFGAPTQLKRLVVFGWGVPLVLTVVVAAVEVGTDGSVLGLAEGSVCWISTEAGLAGTVMVPLGVMVVFNTSVIVQVVRQLLQKRTINATAYDDGKRKRSRGTSVVSEATSETSLAPVVPAHVTANTATGSPHTGFRRLIVLTVALIVALSLTWIVAFVALSAGTGAWYVFVILNSAQGFLLFVLFMMRGQTWREIRRVVGRRLSTLQSADGAVVVSQPGERRHVELVRRPSGRRPSMDNVGEPRENTADEEDRLEQQLWQRHQYHHQQHQQRYLQQQHVEIEVEVPLETSATHYGRSIRQRLGSMLRSSLRDAGHSVERRAFALTRVSSLSGIVSSEFDSGENSMMDNPLHFGSDLGNEDANSQGEDSVDDEEGEGKEFNVGTAEDDIDEFAAGVERAKTIRI